MEICTRLGPDMVRLWSRDATLWWGGNGNWPGPCCTWKGKVSSCFEFVWVVWCLNLLCVYICEQRKAWLGGRPSRQHIWIHMNDFLCAPAPLRPTATHAALCHFLSKGKNVSAVGVWNSLGIMRERIIQGSFQFSSQHGSPGISASLALTKTGLRANLCWILIYYQDGLIFQVRSTLLPQLAVCVNSLYLYLLVAPPLSLEPAPPNATVVKSNSLNQFNR